jgi:K+-transporting ATPase ATPase C chain
MKIIKSIFISLRLIIVGLIIFSVIYPLVLLGVGQIWSFSARGSVVTIDDRPVGSALIGQSFTAPHFFHSRPSSINYDASNSGSANLGPENKLLAKRVSEQLEELSSPEISGAEVSADMVTESASGLDPHISPESAYLQVSRVSAGSGISTEELEKMIDNGTEGRLLGVFGGKRINVLELNMKVLEVLNNEQSKQ